MHTQELTAVLLVVAFIVSVSRAQTLRSHETAQAGSFVALMEQAMERMHKDMAIASSGDPDRDFAAMMIPHHQGRRRHGEGRIAVWQEPGSTQAC